MAASLLCALAALAFADPPPDRSRPCAACHRQIWETYQQTGMARSFYSPSPSHVTPGSFYHEPSQSFFTMLERNGEFFQRRHRLDAQGQPTHILEKRIDYVMGSGNHARTFLHRTSANTLLELPLGWYAEKGGFYAMNPGYDRPDHEDFRRPITFDCMFCHNANPSVPLANQKPHAEAVYRLPLPQGIDCERCHGSGARHMQLAGAQAAAAQIRAAIVNPARLPAARQMDICLSCHLESTSFPLPNAIQRVTRAPFSFQPGEALANFILNFDHAPGTGHDDKFEIVNAGYRLRQSACFQKSENKLTCTTCHNPHDAPRGARAAQQYATACRQCHATVPATHTRQEDCATCHMPKRRTEDVIHVLATDHRILRRPPAGNLVAERAERHDTYRGPVVPLYPEKLTGADELYLAAAQVKQQSNLKAGIVQLTQAIQKHRPPNAEWYLDLAEALDRDGQLIRALPWYREAARRAPASAAMAQKLGSTLRRANRAGEAEPVLKRALALDAARAVTWHELALTQRTLGRPVDARASLHQALRHHPDFAEAHNNLGILEAAAGQPATAEKAFRESLRLRPNHPDAHANLAQFLAHTRRDAEAEWEFKVALRQNPKDAPTHHAYALLLGRLQRYPDAQRELEAALQINPAFADAHELLAELLAAQNETARALTHSREAARLRQRKK